MVDRLFVCVVVPGNLFTDEQEREERLAAARRELEYKQLKDCTFEPARASSVAQPDGPVVVRGLGRYLENKDLARRIEQDRKAREAEAFSVRGATKSVPGAPTVPEPFNLSTDPRGKARQAKIAQQARVRPNSCLVGVRPCCVGLSAR